MTGGATLIQGQSLRLPAGVVKSTHNASTFKTYDPGEINGDLSPTTIRPQNNAAGKKGCGGFGAILLVVVAVVVTLATAGAAAGALGLVTTATGATASASVAAGMALSGGIGALGLSTGAAIAIGAGAAAVGSVVSQVVGVATGIQEKFSWNAVALAAIGGGVGAGLGGLSKGTTLIGNALKNGFVRGAASSVISQGIGVATGLQDEFSWVGVAASSVGSGVSQAVGNNVADNFGGKLIASGASALANAATRSALDGSSFEDNIIASIPDVIGSALGHAIAGGLGGGSMGSTRARPEGNVLGNIGRDLLDQATGAPGAFLDLGVGVGRAGGGAILNGFNYIGDRVDSGLNWIGDQYDEVKYNIRRSGEKKLEHEAIRSGIIRANTDDGVYLVAGGGNSGRPMGRASNRLPHIPRPGSNQPVPARMAYAEEIYAFSFVLIDAGYSPAEVRTHLDGLVVLTANEIVNPDYFYARMGGEELYTRGDVRMMERDLLSGASRAKQTFTGDTNVIISGILNTNAQLRKSYSTLARDYHSSPNVAELVSRSADGGFAQSPMNLRHILEGDINARGQAGGGHYIRSDSVRILEQTRAADKFGVIEARIAVRNPSTGEWVEKSTPNTFYPETWSRRQTAFEVQSAYQNSVPFAGANNKVLWRGYSPSGIEVNGYYTNHLKSPNGGASTAWPVHQGN